MGNRRRSRSRWSTRTWVVAGVVALLVAGSGGLAVAALNGPTADVDRITAERERITAEATARASEEAALRELRSRCLGAPTRDAASGCVGADLGDQLVPISAKDDAVAYCWTSAGDQPLASCEYGSKNDDATRVALIGDSHARHLMPGLEMYASANNWAITSFFGNGCSLTTSPLDTCTTAGRSMIESLTTGEPFDVVAVSVSRRKAVNDVAVTEAVERVQDTGARVVFMEDVPTVTPEAIACIGSEDFDPAVPSSCSAPREGMKPDLMIELADSLDGVAVGRITDWFCDATQCPVVIGNTIVYADDGAHVTATYSRTVGPYVGEAIRSAAGL